MTGAPRQASPRGRDPRITGYPTLLARLSFVVVAALGLMVQGLGLPAAQAQEPQRVPVRRLVTVHADSLEGGNGDSLSLQIERYSHMIESLRDSLGGSGDFEISDAQRESFERSIDEISRVIEQISAEMADLEFQIDDNTISFLDEAGDGIIIRIPENLDEKLSEGLEAVTQMVLQEIPDTLDISGQDHKWTWPGARSAPHPKRQRITDGNVVKIGDDLLVDRDEDVHGEVVVVFGDAEVTGRVDGNVVVVFGDLRLDAAAEVTGQVVTIGGRLDLERGAEVGDVVVVDPFGGRRGLQPSMLFEEGWRAFVVCQTLFLLMLVVALVAAVAAPAERFRAILDTLVEQPVVAAGVGMVAALGAHVVVIILAAVLVLTVIGLPLAVLLALAMTVAGIIATAVAAAALGERVCRRSGGCPSRWLAVLVGMVLLHALSFLGSLLGLIPAMHFPATVFSILGALVKIAAYAAGVGALVLSRFGSRAPQS